MGSRKRQRESAPTTLMSLGDDMLAEILRRLPSQPSLARAAFACPRLRDVASSVANSSLSPGPLLGYFLSVVGCAIPAFHRALLRPDRDVAAIVGRGDFQLAKLEDYKWRLMDSLHGLLLLTSDRCLAVFDPVSRSRLRVPHHSSTRRAGGKWSPSSSFHCFLPAGGDASTASFRVLCLDCTERPRVRAHVYSPCTGEWSSHSPAPKGINAPRRGDPHAYRWQPMRAGRRIHWRTRGDMLTSLDLVSMEYSHLRMPDGLDHVSRYAMGETEDGTTCFVEAITGGYDAHLLVWLLNDEHGSSSSWEQRRVDASEWNLGVTKAARSTDKASTSGSVKEDAAGSSKKKQV